MDYSTIIHVCWTSLFVILRGVGSICRFYSICFDENPVSKECSPYQTPHDMASDLGLHCLPVTLLRVSRKEWVEREEFAPRSKCQLLMLT